MKVLVRKEDFSWVKTMMVKLNTTASYEGIRIQDKDYYIFNSNNLEFVLNARSRLSPEELLLMEGIR